MGEGQVRVVRMVIKDRLEDQVRETLWRRFGYRKRLEFQQGCNEIVLFFSLMEIMCPDILCLNFFCGKLFLRKGLATWVTDARKPQGKGAHARWERWHCPLDGNHSSPERRGMVPSFVAQPQFIFYLNSFFPPQWLRATGEQRHYFLSLWTSQLQAQCLAHSKCSANTWMKEWGSWTLPHLGH